MNDLTLIFSLISLGFFGGFSHCVGMCGPFVLTQVGNRMAKTPIENFSELQRLKNLALFPYHLGRISTYSLIGFFCSWLTKSLQNIIEFKVGFKIFSAIFLIIAIAVFVNFFFDGRLQIKTKIQLRFKSVFLKKFLSFPAKKISFLFQSPYGLKGYFLGIILGFIPCGLLYSAFLIAGSFSSPIMAMVGMILFGMATFPSLFCASYGGHFFTKLPEFKFIGKIVILLNIITLLLMVIKLIKN